MEKKRKLVTKCGLGSVGLSWEKLGELSEDYEFILDDDDEFKKTRDFLRENIKNLSREERIGLLDNLYESGRINNFQYSDLYDRYVY